MAFSLWDILQKLLNLVINIGNKLWWFFSTPFYDIVQEWNLPWWLDWFDRAIKWLSGPDGIIPDATFLSFLPFIIGLILVIRLILLFVGRG